MKLTTTQRAIQDAVNQRKQEIEKEIAAMTKELAQLRRELKVLTSSETRLYGSNSQPERAFNGPVPAVEPEQNH